MHPPRVTSSLLAAHLLLAASHSALSDRELLTPTSVHSASSANDSFASSNLIDNSGLSAIATTANYESVTHAPASSSRSWRTADPGGRGSDFFVTGTPPPVLTFTFDEVQVLTDLVVWGYYFTTPNNSEAKRMALEFSSDGGLSWTPPIEITHARSAANHERISFGDEYEADTVRITITDNHFGSPGAVGGDRVGLGEVKFLGGSLARPDPQIDVVPIVDFGTIPLGAPAPSMPLVVANLSTLGELTVNANAPGSPFQLTGAPLNIPAGDSRELLITFTPIPGCHLNNLELTTNDPDRPVITVQLLGSYDCSLDPPSQPSLRPSEGTFVDSLEVTMETEDEGAIVIYTTDGSLPGPANGTPYTGPLTVTSSMQIRAAASRGGLVSKPQTKSYLRLSGGLEEYTSPLPIAIIDNFGAGAIPNKGWSQAAQTGAGLQQVARQPACLHLIDRHPESGMSSMTGIPDLTERIGIRVRGAFSSTWFPKPYSVETWDEFNNDKTTTPLGLPGESDWILDYPHPDYDRQLIANTFTWELSRQTGRYGTRFRFVDVFINQNGGDLTPADRVGVYALAEKVTRDDDRIEFEKLSEDGSSGGWLLSVNRMDPIPVGGFPAENGALTPQYFHTAGPDRLLESPPNTPGGGDDIPRQYNGFFNFEDPSGYRINPAQRATIESWFRNFENVLYNDDDWLDPVDGYRKHLNTRDFIDYFHLHNLAKQGDSMLLSLFPWVSSDDRLLHLGPLWDFNLGAYRLEPTEELFYRNDRLWFPRLFEDPEFMREYVDRWYELRRGPFSTPNMHRILNRQAAEFTFDLAVKQGHSVSSWSNELSGMRNYLSSRAAWIDSQFFRPPTFNHPGGVVDAQFTLVISNNTGTAGTIFFTVDGSDPIAGGPNANIYSEPLAFNATAHVKARVRAANGDWSALNEASYVTGTPAGPGDLVLSEIMYHPFGDPGAEFLELLNINPIEPLDLALVRFAAGVEFTFPVGSTLAPGERILVVRDLLSFEAVHGFGHNVAGEFELDSALDNSGDHLTLLSASGEIILDFTYGDDPPWPESADGDGDSLVLIDPILDPAHDDFIQWRSSTSMDGNPGVDDRVIFGGDPLSDDDGDRLPGLLEHALGTSDLAGNQLTDFLSWHYQPSGETDLFLVRSLAALDVNLVIEFSDDLTKWHSLEEAGKFDEHLTAGRVRYRWSLPAPGPPHRYFRVRASGR